MNLFDLFNFSVTWNTAFSNTPASTDDSSEGPDRFQELKDAIYERGTKEHVMSLASGLATEDGYHREGSAIGFVQATEPTTNPNGDALGPVDKGRILFNTTTGLIEYFDGSSWVTAGTAAPDIAWSSDATYVADDIVSDSGVVYKALQAATGTNLLSDQDYWEPITRAKDSVGMKSGMILVPGLEGSNQIFLTVGYCHLNDGTSDWIVSNSSTVTFAGADYATKYKWYILTIQKDGTLSTHLQSSDIMYRPSVSVLSYYYNQPHDYGYVHTKGAYYYNSTERVIGAFAFSATDSAAIINFGDGAWERGEIRNIASGTQIGRMYYTIDNVGNQTCGWHVLVDHTSVSWTAMNVAGTIVGYKTNLTWNYPVGFDTGVHVESARRILGTTSDIYYNSGSLSGNMTTTNSCVLYAVLPSNLYDFYIDVEVTGRRLIFKS